MEVVSIVKKTDDAMVVTVIRLGMADENVVGL